MKLRQIFFCDDRATKIAVEMMLTPAHYARDRLRLLEAFAARPRGVDVPFGTTSTSDTSETP